MISLESGGAGQARMGPKPPRGPDLVMGGSWDNPLDPELVPNVKRGTGSRGTIKGWTSRSVFNFMKRCARIEWPGRPLVFITLTYPGIFEADPDAWKEHLRRFSIAWSRQWGAPMGVWAMEFQSRGAPHFHLAMVLPASLALVRARDAKGKEIRVAPPQLREWVARTWYELAGHGDIRHLNQHSKAEHCKPADRSGILGYLQRELGKAAQKTLPEWLQERGAGRWWGSWGLSDASLAAGIDHVEYQAIHRIARRLGHQRLKADLLEAFDSMSGWHCPLNVHTVTIRDRDGLPVATEWVRRRLRRVHRLEDRLRRPRRRHEWLTLFEKSRRQWRLAEDFHYLLRVRRWSIDRLALSPSDRIVYADALREGRIHPPPSRGSFEELERSIRDRSQLSLWAVA